MKGRIALDSMTHEFRLLRNRIEAEIHAPALIIVTSATERDGASLTAFGLSESLSKTKQRVVLVTTGSGSQNSIEEQSVPNKAIAMRRRASDRFDAEEASAEGHFSMISVSRERLATISRTSVDSLVKDLRSKYDYVVIDAGNLPKNTFGLLLVATAEATLIAFRSGRSQVPADRLMLDTLERSEAKILGVVMTDEGAIAQFTMRDEPAVVQEALPEVKPSLGVGKRLGVAISQVEKPS